MTEAARFLRDLLLHPELRDLASTNLDRALAPYAVTADERALLRAQDPALLDILGQAVRNLEAPERPASVERLTSPVAATPLDPAHLWLRLLPFATDQTVNYSVGIAAGSSNTVPFTPALDGTPLPVIDLDIRVQPTLAGTQLSFAGSMLPRGIELPPPHRAKRHAAPDHPAVRRAASRALLDPTYDNVLAVLDALTAPDPDAVFHEPLPAPPVSTGPHLQIVGLGMCSPDHVTLETERTLRRARHVLFADPSIALPDWLAARCPRVTPLLSAYVQGDSRLHTYHHMAAASLVAALTEAPAVFAMSGHPLVGAYAPFLLLDAGRALGLDVRIQPGITALDSILALLEIDPILTGLQMVEATDLLLQGRPLQPDMPTLVWQIGTVGTQLHSDHRRSEADLAPLRDHLLRFHPDQHEVIAVYASPHPAIRSTQLPVPLADLASLAPQLHAGFSLFVPASVDRPLADPTLLAGMYDPSALS